MGRQLFLIDPIGRLRPEKDSSVALMQAGQRAGEEIWAAQPSDLAAGEGGVHKNVNDICNFVTPRKLVNKTGKASKIPG